MLTNFMSMPSAIALSLQEANNAKLPAKKKPVEVIEIDDSDDDDVNVHGSAIDPEEARFQEELRRVMELSKVETGPSSASSSRQAYIPPTQAAASSASGTNSLLMDRRRMEEERLARQKRLRPGIVQSSANVSDEEDEEDDGMLDGGRSAKRQRLSSTIPSARRANATSSSNPTGVTNARASGSATSQEPLFWNGELRQTANAHVDPEKDTRPVFRLSDVIGLVSTSVFDFPGTALRDLEDRKKISHLLCYLRMLRILRGSMNSSRYEHL